MQRVFYPAGTKLGREIFNLIPDSEIIPYNPSELTSLQSEKISVLIANTRLIINEETINRYKHVSCFATVSSGTDHVDWNMLRKYDRKFMNSPGCNASSVAEYIVVALHKFYKNISDLRIGLIGYGQVGKVLGKILDSHGLVWKFYDPFISSSKNWNEVWKSDVVSCHVPLTWDGRYPTFGFIGEGEISNLQSNSMFINTSRGEILTQSGVQSLIRREDINLVLDVFDPEPPNEDLIGKLITRKNSIYTPHIAGYSQIGRILGIYRLACRLAERVGRKYPKPIDSFLQKNLDFKTETFLDFESDQLKSAFITGNNQYFEERRGNYPLREDIGVYSDNSYLYNGSTIDL
ncbi:NAD(P)-dependent oxidoreductase [Leptospira sp. GIMC2001]|uniref:NAD(P)-dependent oxidoreductase n=1 Tax=Leptospira sp. GIMC2001 TaxID=1513297 RepID=UPI00234B7E7B|nr:NAD(P)-dependent oxidoreductase [Leptospira sp. GIMC2001]WCL50355.1 NAD(P)-dependent oxidoreductase [Leptospira sp. GIMC2001]